MKKYHPEIALFVQTSPAFCCPSIVTEAMAREIEHKTKTPVVSITYDGTGGNKNESIIPYLKYSASKYLSRFNKKFQTLFKDFNYRKVLKF
jgi:hypothetical protein